MKKVYSLSLCLCGLIILSGCVPPQQTKSTRPEVKAYQTRTKAKQYGSSPYYARNTPVVSSNSSGSQQTASIPVTESNYSTIQEQDIGMGQEAFSPSVMYINNRLSEYGRRLERWKEIDRESLTQELPQEETDKRVECFKNMQVVLNGYSQYREELMLLKDQGTGQQMDGMRFLQLQKADIAFLEGECGVLTSGQSVKSPMQDQGEPVDLARLETQIDIYAANAEYEEVVQSWLQIPKYQIKRVGLKSRVSYGVALTHLHQEEKAAEVFQQIVNEMSSSKEQSTDLISLRKMLADLYTASGSYPLAEKQYKKIAEDYLNLGKIEEWAKLQRFILERSEKGSPELVEYSGLLRDYLGFIPEKDGYQVVRKADTFLQKYPYSAVASNVDMIKADSKKRADAWFGGLMKNVDSLAGKKKYEEGLELLETVPKDIIDRSKLDQLRAKSDKLLLDEAVDRETVKQAKRVELQRKMNEAQLQLEAKEYEAAIDIYISLLDTEFATRASAKIEEVTNSAANNGRRKARDLFMQYTDIKKRNGGDFMNASVQEVENAKMLLVNCRKILNDTVKKYPGADTADKIVENIKVVEDQMNMIDPALLPEVIRLENNPSAGSEGYDPFADPMNN